MSEKGKGTPGRPETLGREHTHKDGTQGYDYYTREGQKVHIRQETNPPIHGPDYHREILEKAARQAEQQRRDEQQRREQQQRSGSGPGGSGGSGKCYIATATLQQGGNETQLDLLRRWRDDVLRPTRAGRNLEAFYDMTGPMVASAARKHPLLAASFYYPFVRPSVWLAEQRVEKPWLAPVCSLALYTLFLFGLAYGSFVYLLLRVFQ